MKNLVFAAIVLSASLVVPAPASGQVKSVAAANNQPSSTKTNENQTSANTTRARVLSQDSKSAPVGSIVSSGTASRSKLDLNNHAEAARFRRVNNSPATAPLDSSKKTAANVSVEIATTDRLKLNAALANKSVNMSANIAPPVNTVASVPATVSATATQVYRVGVRDVLDIQLADHPGRNSTLFTVLEDGVLEYPLAGDPIVVEGMTPSEIETLLRQRIKIFDNPAVAVTVRDYASHAVSISGFVAAPGAKLLRREAVPLYTVLAEALILPEAARATITRQGRAPIEVDLKDTNLSATLVLPGDVIKVAGQPAAPTEFYFVGGEISSPGQKPYHAGLTLTQAILASGGMSATAGAKVRVSRQGSDGKLTSEEYNLRKIQTGKTADPILQNGDRIEVTTGN
ncbi:MAG TPA: polysaccharide biosynthesis/export family protein [Pyrinomonadaceae bacterium]|nr:polysaccharide biosynthesis/export family protein [Pyrinomonadaceae bacterium]